LRIPAEALRRVEEIEAFQRVASHALSSPDLVTALGAVVREIRALLRSDGAACSVVNPERTLLEGGTAVGTRARPPSLPRLESGQGLTGLVLQERCPLRTDDYFADPRFARPPDLAGWAAG